MAGREHKSCQSDFSIKVETTLITKLGLQQLHDFVI